MVERDGVRKCLRVDLPVISSVVDRVLRGDEASMLVKVEVPAGLEATEMWFRGTVVALGELVVTAQPTHVRVEAVGRGAWSGGGAAWGTVNERGVWNAVWRDGFGEGTWKLELDAAAEFSGVQFVDVHSGDGFAAAITGQRTSDVAPELDCADVYEQAK